MTIINRSVLLTALFVMNAAAVLLWPSAALAKERTDIVRMNFTWDENYLYAAVEVNDPDIQGSTKAPNQPVGDDDAVAIYLQTDRKKDAAIGPNSFRMLVSAAGGCEFSHGEDGKWVKKDIFTFKYAVKVDGSVSQDQDDDSGYTVEIAIPWTELGLAGNIGTSMLFNATVQMKGEHTGFLSLVKGVQTDADRDNPSKWDELWLRGPVQPLVIRNPGRIMINRSLQHRPVVDGRMLASEYNEKSAFEIQKPPIKQAVHILRDFPVENLIFASYYYHYDTTEPQSSFVNKPFGGFGPWFTGSRIEFHRGMLRDARRAGIDVLLAVNSVTPLPANRTATLALVGALKEMTIAKEAYPLVALMLASPADATGGQQAIWAAITRFYSQIPPEYRTTVRLPESRGGQTALPVFIKGTVSLTKETRAWLDEQAQAEYGEKLLVVSDESAGGEADGFLPNFAPGTGRGY
ncbi:MAG: sugar-binding protein, partial [Armatimonadota bacterium]